MVPKREILVVWGLIFDWEIKYEFSSPSISREYKSGDQVGFLFNYRLSTITIIKRIKITILFFIVYSIQNTQALLTLVLASFAQDTHI